MNGRVPQGLGVAIEKTEEISFVWGSLCSNRVLTNTVQNRLRLAIVQNDPDALVGIKDCVSPRVLSKHNAMFAAQFQWVHALIISNMLQKAINMDPGFMSENILADNALVRSDGFAGCGGNQIRDRGKLVD
jgi:hypothetical protein